MSVDTASLVGQSIMFRFVGPEFTPADRVAFNARMNLLKKPARGSVLTGNRQGWYEFTEKMLRGYARLRALREAVVLEREHPLQPRRFGGLMGHLSENGGHL